MGAPVSNWFDPSLRAPNQKALRFLLVLLVSAAWMIVLAPQPLLPQKLADPSLATLSTETSPITLRAGYLAQRVMFDVGYGAHLERRFGARYVDLTGVALSGVLHREERFAYGLEVDALWGGFDYTTLNGEPGRVDFYLQQHIFKAHWLPVERWELAVGLGHGWLVRSLEGYRSANINAENLAGNGGVAQTGTHGAVIFGEALYRFFEEDFGAEVGLRYGYAPHLIPKEDPRPALDEAQRPVDSVFNVGGFAYLLTAVFRFGGSSGQGGVGP